MVRGVSRYLQEHLKTVSFSIIYCWLSTGKCLLGRQTIIENQKERQEQLQGWSSTFSSSWHRA